MEVIGFIYGLGFGYTFWLTGSTDRIVDKKDYVERLALSLFWPFVLPTSKMAKYFKDEEN
jgi:hypothetical protein